jgi:hypothetical protein
VIQTPATLYGRDYFLGDLVTGYYQGITSVKQITGLTITFQDTGGSMVEAVKVLTENP